MQKEASGKGGGRRKSAFAEEDQGYMFVEEGFRIRFANGETIDFYANSAAEKDGWMKALSDVVGKESNNTKSWTSVVLAKQRTAAQKAEQKQMRPPTTRTAPSSPAKRFDQSFAPPPPDKNPRHSPVAQRRVDAPKTRSMIF